jgi:phosphoribosylaminoimidazole-succinocarboxamide synthase
VTKKLSRGDVLYEGKAKIIYKTEDPGILWAHFKDDATAFDGEKKGTIVKKGEYNTELSAFLYELLEKNGIPTHLKEVVGERDMLVRNLDMFPVEIVMRNVAAGSICKRYGLERGIKLPQTILEYYLKDDSLHDPMMNRQHVIVLGYVGEDTLAEIETVSFKVNEVLGGFMAEKGITLVDFKMEFGTDGSKIYLGDEITPDTCRLWDSETGEVFDKDRFRFDMGEVESHYEAVVKRLMG